MALLDGQNGSEGSPGRQGKRSGGFPGRPGGVWETLLERWKPLGVSPGEPEGWESLPKGRMGGPPEWPEWVGRLSRMARRGREAFLDGWEGSEGPPGAWDGLEGPPEQLGGVGRPSQRAGSRRESLPESQRVGRPSLKVEEYSGGRGGFWWPSQWAGGGGESLLKGR